MTGGPLELLRHPADPALLHSPDPLLEPLQVRGVVLRNRAVSTAHGAFPSFWSLADSGQEYISYQRRRAAGGVGLIILQYLQVEPLDEQWPDCYVERLSRMADAIHAEGARVLLQLTSFGAQARQRACTDGARSGPSAATRRRWGRPPMP